MANLVTQIVIRARDEASSVFGSLQAKAAAVGAAIAGYFTARLFGDAISSARGFEAAMSAVQAAAGASGEELAALRAAAEEAGASTQYSSVEAAGALENLAKAGLSATDAVKALPAVLDLATAGGVGLGEASDYIAKAVAGMGLSFAEAGRVADVLAMGANASNTSVTGLAQALSYAAPLASSLGLSIEQTVAIIGKFADAGIDASRAGTALNGILAQFSDPASQFRRELAAAGITTGDFDQALRQLAAAGPDGQRAINAVGQEAGPALRALLNQGIGALDALKGKLDESAGSAATFAAVMSDNLDGATKGFASAWEALLINLGSPVLETLKGQINAVSERLRGFVTDGTATAFGNAIKTAFEAAGRWVAEFAAKVDFTQVATNLQAFAARVGEIFTAVGQYATTAGNAMQTAYGVMSAGVNTVLAAVYKVGQGMSWLTSAFLADLATITQGLAKITFGDISAGFASAAESMRMQAQAAYSVFEAFGQKAGEAFDAATQGALTAREGWNGLTTAATEAATSTTAALQQVETQAGLTADQVAALGDGAVVMGGKVVEAGTQAAAAAGNVQTLGTAANQAAAGVADLEASAEQVASAFERLGVTSTAELARIAANAKRDFETIRNSGTASTEDIRRAFAAYAARAIEANKGVADYTLRAQAAMYGVRIEAGEMGAAVVSAAQAGASALAGMGQQAEAVAGKIGLIKREASGLSGVWDENGNLIPESADRSYAGGQGGRITSYTERGAYERAKSEGLDDETALMLAAEFANTNRLFEFNEAIDRAVLAQARESAAMARAAESAAQTQAQHNQSTACTQPGRASEQVTTYRVQIGTGAGRSQTINTASKADAEALTALLQQLEADMSRS